VISSITRTTIAMYEHPDDEGEESDIVVCILRTPVTGVDVTYDTRPYFQYFF